MKNILAISMSLLLTMSWSVGCSSTQADSKITANHKSKEDFVLVEENEKNNMKNRTEQPIKLQLLAEEVACIKSKFCKVVLEIQNISNEDIEVGGLEFILRPYSTGSRVPASSYINSPVAIDNLENLRPNRPNRLIVKANQTLEKEVDIGKIRWLKSIQSSGEYNDLWERIVEGKYELFVELGVYPKTPPTPKKGKIGDIEVDFVDFYKAESNYLILDFKEK